MGQGKKVGGCPLLFFLPSFPPAQFPVRGAKLSLSLSLPISFSPSLSLLIRGVLRESPLLWSTHEILLSNPNRKIEIKGGSPLSPEMGRGLWGVGGEQVDHVGGGGRRKKGRDAPEGGEAPRQLLFQEALLLLEELEQEHRGEKAAHTNTQKGGGGAG